MVQGRIKPQENTKSNGRGYKTGNRWRWSEDTVNVGTENKKHSYGSSGTGRVDAEVVVVVVVVAGVRAGRIISWTEVPGGIASRRLVVDRQHRETRKRGRSGEILELLETPAYVTEDSDLAVSVWKGRSLNRKGN